MEGFELTSLQVSSAAFLVAVVSAIFSIATFIRNNARVKLRVKNAEVNIVDDDPLDSTPKVHISFDAELVNRGLAESDIRALTMWFLILTRRCTPEDIVAGPQVKKDDDTTLRVKANQTLEWRVSVSLTLVEFLAHELGIDPNLNKLNLKWILRTSNVVFYLVFQIWSRISQLGKEGGTVRFVAELGGGKWASDRVCGWWTLYRILKYSIKTSRQEVKS